MNLTENRFPLLGIMADGFECEAGPLENCAEWIELRRRLNLPPTEAA